MSRLLEALRTLEQERQITRSLTATVRAEIAAIQAARAAGLTFDQICQGFAAMGVHVTTATLRQTFYRVLRESTSTPPAKEWINGSSALPLPPLLHASQQAGEHMPAGAVAQQARKPAGQLCEGRPPDAAIDPDVFGQLRQSTPDIDALADRFRSRRAAARRRQAAEAAAAATAGTEASLSTSLSTSLPSSLRPSPSRTSDASSATAVAEPQTAPQPPGTRATITHPPTDSSPPG